MRRGRFLDTPPRATKPRARGLTHVLDKGAPRAVVQAHLASHAELIDVWKMGWGTAYVSPDLSEKIEVLTRARVPACFGGTLLEIAWVQGKADEFLAWARDAGFAWVEVSNGAVDMPAAAKSALIERAAERFTVVSEVGSKDPAAAVSPAAWAAEAARDLRCGASWVLTEGRESGTVGLFEPDGTVRAPVADAVVEAVGIDAVIFEAPRRDQQSWLIRRFGPDVGLGNVAPDEVAGLEALRLGLRADTLELSVKRPGARAPSASSRS